MFARTTRAVARAAGRGGRVFASSAATATASAPISDVELASARQLLSGSISAAAAALSAGTTSAAALTEACLSQIELTRACNAYTAVLPSSARAEAAASDARRRAGASLGPLDGIPIAVKDNFCVLGAPSTAASRILEGFVAPYDATVVARLRRAGAVVLGKTNMDEFGMGSHTTNTPHGPARAPLPPSSVPHSNGNNNSHSSSAAVAPSAAAWPLSAGGSSGGSAAAVASLTCFAALGSDTGGSVRLPASYTGTVGLKPTYGLLSRWGLIAYASSLDCPGVIARSGADATAVLDVIQGADELDSTCLFTLTENNNNNNNKTPLTASASASASNGSCGVMTEKTSGMQGLRVGLPREVMFPELPAPVARAWDAAARALSAEGAELVTVSIPALASTLATYYTLAPAEAVSNLSRYDGVRYGPSTAPTLPDRRSHGGSNAQSSAHSAVPNAAVGSPLQQLYTANRSAFFGPEVRRRVLLGNFVLSSSRYSAYVGTATRLRGALQSQLTALLRTSRISQPLTRPTSAARTASTGDAGVVDMLLLPTATSGAPELAQLAARARADPLADVLDDLMTVGASLAGLPAVSAPAGADEQGRPLGVQLVGPALSERALLAAADVVAQSAAAKNAVVG